MQDRYVGDVGDFAKYSLLQSLVGDNERLGIIWCLFPDELHNSDGRHTGYLRRPEFRSLNPTLYDQLGKIVVSGRRSVSQVSRSKIFSPETICFSLPIARANTTGRLAREVYRQKWLARSLDFTSSCDIVFFDPDNGVETPSVPRHSPKAGKYIFFEELNLFWQRGQSIVLYHHLNRIVSVSEQTRILKKRFCENFSDAAFVRSLLFRRGSCRHFWIFGQPAHSTQLNARVQAMLSSGWHAYFELG